MSARKMRLPEFENNIPNMSSAEYAQFLTRVIQMVNAGSLNPKSATDFINAYNDATVVREPKDHISHLHKDIFKNIAKRLDPADLVSLRVASKTIHNRFIQQYMIDRLPFFEKAIAETFDLIKLMNSRAFKYIISCQIALSPSVHLKFNSYTPQLYIEEVKVTLKNLNNRSSTHISRIDRVKIETSSKPNQNRHERAKRIASILNRNLSFNDVAKLKTKALLKTEVLIYTDRGEHKLFEHFGSSLTPVVFPAEVKAIESVPFKNAIHHLEVILKTFSEALNQHGAADSVAFDIEEFRFFDEGEAPASTSASASTSTSPPRGGRASKKNIVI